MVGSLLRSQGCCPRSGSGSGSILEAAALPTRQVQHLRGGAVVREMESSSTWWSHCPRGGSGVLGTVALPTRRGQHLQGEVVICMVGLSLTRRGRRLYGGIFTLKLVLSS
jgi:hypothetical protein